jgi:hypothetical protein
MNYNNQYLRRIEAYEKVLKGEKYVCPTCRREGNTMNINLKVEILKDKIVCADLRTLQIVLGSTAVQGNHKLYGVTKTSKGFEILKTTLNNRLAVLHRRKQSIDETINLLEKITTGKNDGKRKKNN